MTRTWCSCSTSHTGTEIIEAVLNSDASRHRRGHGAAEGKEKSGKED